MEGGATLHGHGNAMDRPNRDSVFHVFRRTRPVEPDWRAPTFGLMAMVTAVAVLLSIRHDSMFVALLGLVGGFATPALLSTVKTGRSGCSAICCC